MKLNVVSESNWVSWSDQPKDQVVTKTCIAIKRHRFLLFVELNVKNTDAQ